MSLKVDHPKKEVGFSRERNIHNVSTCMDCSKVEVPRKCPMFATSEAEFISKCLTETTADMKVHV